MRRLLLAGLVLAAAGCDRIPIDPIGTNLLVAAPDLSVVFLEPNLVVRLVPEGPSRPLTLRIRDKLIDFDSTAGAFIYEKQLNRGLNVYPLTVTDEAGEVQRDTLYAVYLPLQRLPLFDVDEGPPRVGAAVAPLAVESILVSGGVDAGGAARATASVVEVVGSRFQSEEVPLGAARAGHTATAVGGGVLLVGGTRTSAPSGVGDFVRQVEWVGPDRSTRPVAIRGGEEGPARVGHLARAIATDGETYVYILGGRVPEGGGTAVSQTIDVYRVVGLGAPDAVPSLERLSPAGGASGFAALTGATLAATGATTAAAFGLAAADGDASVALRWSVPGTATFPFSLRVAPAAALQTPRADAAAVDLGGGLALVLGGRDASGNVLGSLEVYAAAADRTFRFPSAVGLTVPRSGHVATILSGDRILVVDGRPAQGGPVVAAEAFRL